MSKIARGTGSLFVAKVRLLQPSSDHLSIIRVPLLGLTAYVWWVAIHDWVSFFHEAYGNSSLGYDLNFSWLAAKQFARGGAPYSVPGFVYPPSHVLIAWPLAAASFTTIKHIGLYVTVIAMCTTVMVSAEIVGRRFWGLAAALGVLLLRFAQPPGDEIVLENVSAIMGLAFAWSLLLSARHRWMSAAVVLGIATAIKPMLLPMYLIFLFAKQWRSLLVAVGIPAVLNVVAFFVIHGIGQFWSVLPFLFDRSGATYDAYNAALVSVGQLVGLNAGVILVLRIVAGVLAIIGGWWAWRKIADYGVRVVTTSGALMLGVYLSGTLTEDHYMLTLIPLLVSVVGTRSPLRWPVAWVGGAWLMAYRDLSSSTLHVSGLDAQAVSRCIGLGLILVTICIAPFVTPIAIRWTNDAKRSISTRTRFVRPLSAAIQRSIHD